MKKYWYRQYIGECPVCGDWKGYKERVYGKKPKNPNKIYIQIPDTSTYDNCLGY